MRLVSKGEQEWGSQSRYFRIRPAYLAKSENHDGKISFTWLVVTQKPGQVSLTCSSLVSGTTICSEPHLLWDRVVDTSLGTYCTCLSIVNRMEFEAESRFLNSSHPCQAGFYLFACFYQISGQRKSWTCKNHRGMFIHLTNKKNLVLSPPGCRLEEGSQWSPTLLPSWSQMSNPQNWGK